MLDEKKAIAIYCAKLINDTDFVYIDAGTTTDILTDYITNKNATYVTNGITHAKNLIRKGLTTYTIGGRIKPATEAIMGAEGLRSLKTFNFTKSFMGTNGIELNAGLIKEEVIKRSYMSFVLADNTKFRKVFPITFAELKDCCIITDKLPYNEFSEKTIIKEVMK